MAEKIKPLADRVVVKPIEREKVSKGGIVLPDTATFQPVGKTTLLLLDKSLNLCGDFGRIIYRGCQ